jgi:hypothetical protein
MSVARMSNSLWREDESAESGEFALSAFRSQSRTLRNLAAANALLFQRRMAPIKNLPENK